MYSLYLPSSQLQDLTAQLQQVQRAEEELPGNISDLADKLDGCIEVDIDEPDASVVHAGLDRSGRKAVEEIAKQVETAAGEIGEVQRMLIEQIGIIFKHYIRVQSRPETEPSPDNLQEQFEAYIDKDLRGLSVYEWKDALEFLPASSVLSQVFTHWTPEMCRRLGWWDYIENKMKLANATGRAAVDSFMRGDDIDPAWRETILENIKRGPESEALLRKMAGACAVAYAMKAPTDSFMGWTRKQWYKHITSLDLTPEYSSSLIATLIRPPEKVGEATPESVQKTIMARFRRLFFLDPEFAKKTFGLFAPGKGEDQAVLIPTDSATNDLKQIFARATAAFHSNFKTRLSLGQNLSNFFSGLDQALEKAGISTPRGYADLFHELRTELQLGAEVSARLKQNCGASIPKM